MKPDIQIRPLETFDERTIRGFFDSLGDIDLTFLHAAVLRPGVIGSWIRDASSSRDRRYLASIGDDVVGYLAVLPENDWSSHVASLRIVVHPGYRRQGIATALARHAVVTAARGGVKKLVVEVLAEQEATVAMFTGLGFEAEGLLRDHVLGGAGQSYDLLVLSHFVDELYETMTTAGVEDAVTG